MISALKIFIVAGLSAVLAEWQQYATDPAGQGLVFVILTTILKGILKAVETAIARSRGLVVAQKTSKGLIEVK